MLRGRCTFSWRMSLELQSYPDDLESLCFPAEPLPDYLRERCVVYCGSDSYIAFTRAFEPDGIFIHRIGVSPGSRGYGIASNLLKTIFVSMEKDLPMIPVEARVAHDNIPAMRLFIQSNFLPVSAGDLNLLLRWEP